MTEKRDHRPTGARKGRAGARTRGVLAFAVFMPLSLLAASGCSLARSCAAGRDGEVSRGSTGLASPRPIDPLTRAVPAEGVFTASPDERVTGERVVLKGSVVAVGTEPRVRALFVLEDGSKRYDLYPDARGLEALVLQGRLVEITAILVDPVLASRSRPASRDGVAYPLSWKIVN